MKSEIESINTFPESYRFLQQIVYSHVGIVLADDRNYLIEGRLAPVVKQLGLCSINDLCKVLHGGGNNEVSQMVAEAMTTNETYFFREPLHYEIIKSDFLPRLIEERRSSRKMRFWSAASSTGQEAYSLGMMLIEQGLQDWNIDILGTDFCSKVIERAKAGLYQQIEVNRGLPTSLLLKYFIRSGLNWQLSERIRQMARFQTIDLRNKMRTLGPFDLVFLRNVLIYFDGDTKRKIMKEIHNTMFRGGWLLLGGAETSIDLDEWFERRRIENATVYVAR